MKKIFKSAFLLAIIGGLSAACNVEPVPQPDTDKTPASLELSASLPDVQTKTSLGSEPDYNVLWSEGDQISVNGILSNAVTEEDHGKTQVRFRVEGNLAAPYKVLYPGTDKTNVITLPAVQNYVADSYDAAAYAAYGIVEQVDGENKATLSNFCGLVRFALNGSATLSRIEVNALGGEKLHGAFTLADSFNGEFTGGAEGTLTYIFEEGLKLSDTDTYVYIALPAQTYSAGVEAKVYQADGAFMRLKFWGDGVPLAGNHIRAFESKTYAAGRIEELVGIGDMQPEDGGMPNVPAGVTVAVFNTQRFDEEYRPSDAVTTVNNALALWRPEGAIASNNAAMREALGKVIYNTQADVIGFNEIDGSMFKSGRPNSIEDMARAQGCTDYTFKFFSSSKPESSFYDDPNDYNFANGFAYKSSVLNLDDSGRVWYNLSRSTISTDDKNASSPKVTIVYAQFTHKVSGKQFWLFVTHLPNYDDKNDNCDHNIAASTALNAFAASKAGNLPHFMVGDMNSADHEKNQCQAGAQKLLEYWTDVYDALNEAGNLSSFYQKYCGTQSGTGYIYHYSILDFCKNHPERRIDKIMTKGACTATTYKTVRNTYTVHYSGKAYYDEGIDPETEEHIITEHDVDEDVVCYPSDHLAVVSYITLD